MSDRDNLRDRIAEVIYHEDVVNVCAEPAVTVALSSLSPSEQATYRDFAQAIIDHFGLTTETHAATHAKRTMTRITGAWEWEN